MQKHQFLRTSLLLSLAGILMTGCDSQKVENQSTNIDSDRVYEANKNDLIIGTLLGGTVNTSKKHKLSLGAATKSTISWIIDENSSVKKGEVLVKFQTDDLNDKIESLKVNLDSKNKELFVANEEKRILLSTNKSKKRQADDKVNESREALARFLKYDGKIEESKLKDAITSAEENLKKAEEEYNDLLNTINTKVYEEESQKERDLETLKTKENNVKLKKSALETATLNKKIFKRFTYPNKVLGLENKMEQAKLDLEKVNIESASHVIQKENRTKKIETERNKVKKDLKKNLSYLEMMVITAPADGIVIYGNVDRHRNKIDPQVGLEVRPKQVILTIPDMSTLVVDFELPEQFRYKINVGAKGIITPQSLPNLQVEASVSKIAVIPVNQIRWDASSPKIYPSKLALKKQNDKLVSGMNVQIEIITDTLEDVITIPIEAVFEEQGSYFVYLQKGNKPIDRPIEIGQSNDSEVHIIKGLNKGDIVYLYRPFESSESK